MDLTSLSSTLPRSNPSSEDPDLEPSSTLLLAAFKQTALSVTTLYKTAANEAERSRREGRTEGYHDCLDDLLLFVDKVEGRCEARTLEMLRQWALSKRRKVGGNGAKSKARREDREESVDSEELPMMDNPRSSSPSPQEQQNPTPPPPQPVNNTPSSTKSAPSDIRQQTGVFSFRSNVDLPRHVPPPPRFDNNFEELPDTELYSPPTSPTLSAHNNNIFQTRTISAPSNPPTLRLGSPSSTGRHTQQRTGNKRRIGNMPDFFDFAGMEKMQFETKRRRHQ